MTEDPTREEVLQSIEPKADQLNADDLVVGPATVKIVGVKKGDKEQPIVIELEGHRPYKPCKTMRRVLIASWGDDPREWYGQLMTLYCDPDVTWGGVKVGGIRISHLSGLKEPKTFILTQTRGKKKEVTVFPVATLSPDDAAYIETAKREIAEAETTETLKAIAFVIGKKPKLVRDALRTIYADKQRELTDADTRGKTPAEG